MPRPIFNTDEHTTRQACHQCHQAELNYEQMKALMMSSDEMFECRASVHFANQTIVSNPTVIENCFHRFRVLRDIYSNNEFGICYNFFDKNYRIRIGINQATGMTKISRGGGYFRKIFGQGGIPKIPPTPLFPLPGINDFIEIRIKFESIINLNCIFVNIHCRQGFVGHSCRKIRRRTYSNARTC